MKTSYVLNTALLLGIIKGDEIMVINGAIVSDLDMMYLESVLQEELSLCMMMRSSRTEPPDIGGTLYNTETVSENSHQNCILDNHEIHDCFACVDLVVFFVNNGTLETDINRCRQWRSAFFWLFDCFSAFFLFFIDCTIFSINFCRFHSTILFHFLFANFMTFCNFFVLIF